MRKTPYYGKFHFDINGKEGEGEILGFESVYNGKDYVLDLFKTPASSVIIP